MIGIYYVIRHKVTGELMPELKRTRGYSHWNPSKVVTSEHLKTKLLGTPRLISSRGKAHRCIAQWNALPNGREKINQIHDDVELDYKPDGRSKDDLEVVEVRINDTAYDY